MSSINQILNSALMESSTNLDEAYNNKGAPLTGRLKHIAPTTIITSDEPLSNKLTKQEWLTKNAGKIATGGAALVGAGVIGNEIRKSGNEKTDYENAQVAAHNKALAAHAAAQVVPPTEPPKSFVQRYGDQAKAMWDKSVADGTAKWGEFNTANPNAGKYGAAGLVALGAGIGAVALAKKLRAKKAAVKK